MDTQAHEVTVQTTIAIIEPEAWNIYDGLDKGKRTVVVLRKESYLWCMHLEAACHVQPAPNWA